MTFHAIVKYLEHEKRTTTKGDVKRVYYVIEVQDIKTKRHIYLYDWSNLDHNVKIMSSHAGEDLEVSGHVNTRGRANYLVLERWGLWSSLEQRSKDPQTMEYGHYEVRSKNKV